MGTDWTEKGSARLFSLTECTLLLILLGIMLAVAVSRAGNAGADLAAETAALRTHLRYAQSRAMADTVPWGIQLFSDRYVLLRNGAAAGQLPGNDGSTHMLQGITITAGTGILNFNSWGEPCDSTATILTSNWVATLSKADSTATVVITKNTGFVD